MKRPWILPVAAAVLAFGHFLTAMAYPWQLALLAATAIGAFVYSTRVTWQRLRRLYRPTDTEGRPSMPPGKASSPETAAAATETAPGRPPAADAALHPGQSRS